MELKVRKIIEADWAWLPDWWKDYPNWKDQSIPREMLPENGLGGFIVHKGEHNIAACWLILTNSKMAEIAPVVSYKYYRDTDREEAIELLIHFTTHLAYDMGCEYAHAWSTHENLTKIYEKIGYTGEPCTELTIKL